MESKTNKTALLGLAVALFLTVAFVGTALALDVSSNASVKSGSGNSSGGVGVSTSNITDIREDDGVVRDIPIGDRPRDDYDSLVKVYLEPEKAISENGQATYKVVIKDNHAFVQPCTGEVCTAVVPALYLYKLNFEGDEEIAGKFSQESITILGGNKAEVSLEVYVAKTSIGVAVQNTDDENSDDDSGKEALTARGMPPVRLSSYSFEVTVLGEDAKATANGKLIVPGGKPPEEKGPYFIGKGFGLSEDSSQGVSVDLNIFQGMVFAQGTADNSVEEFRRGDSELSGKISVDNKPYRVEGSLTRLDGSFTGSGFLLDVYSTNSKEKVGTLSGAVKGYSSFTLLTGTLVIDGKNWKVTAFSNKEGFGIGRIIDVNSSSSGGSTEIASVNETLVISGKTSKFNADSSEEQGVVSVKPIEVRNSKILWVFPSGKQEAVVEVDDGSTQSTVVIKEGKSKRVGDYVVSAESITSEGQFNVKIKAYKQ